MSRKYTKAELQKILDNESDLVGRIFNDCKMTVLVIWPESSSINLLTQLYLASDRDSLAVSSELLNGMKEDAVAFVQLYGKKNRSWISDYLENIISDVELNKILHD